MRKDVVKLVLAAGLIVFGLAGPFTGCQSGGSSRSGAQITDPNVAFAQGGAQANAPSRGSSRRSLSGANAQ